MRFYTIMTEKTTAKKSKRVYTPEQEAFMREVYTAAETDEARKAALDEIQRFTGKSLPSIRSKLGQMKIYVSPTKPKGDGKGRVTKADLVQKIADAVPEKPAEFFDSLETTTKPVLQWVLSLVSPESDNGASE